MKIIAILIAAIFLCGCFMDDLVGTKNDDESAAVHYHAPEPNPPVAQK